ncbi:MAG TPA: hypothetical protein VGI73_01675 [Solirubrobacterales bacterium]
MHRRTALAALLACLAVVALVAVPVAGAAKPHATTVVVSLKFPAFHGSLKSKDDGCLGGRKVTMYRKHGGKAKKLGTGTSNAKGKWQVLVGKHLASGQYFATVAAKGECKGGRSQTLPIG